MKPIWVNNVGITMKGNDAPSAAVKQNGPGMASFNYSGGPELSHQDEQQNFSHRCKQSWSHVAKQTSVDWMQNFDAFVHQYKANNEENYVHNVWPDESNVHDGHHAGNSTPVWGKRLMKLFSDTDQTCSRNSFYLSRSLCDGYMVIIWKQFWRDTKSHSKRVYYVFLHWEFSSGLAFN